MRALVLAYHSHRIQNGYAGNDHTALAEDLERLGASGYRLVALTDLVDALLGGRTLPERAVALTCDDGADFDYQDLANGEGKLQPGFLAVLHAFRERFPSAGNAVMTAFVIADPAARTEIAEACLAGLGGLSEDWWPEAVASGLFHIGNHSWDHRHPTLARYADRPGQDKLFMAVENRETADLQVRRAADYIARIAPNPAADLFAYPFGSAPGYLADRYFEAGGHGVRAAFTTEPQVLTPACSRWRLPRFVCGDHWKSGADLEHILRQLG